MSRFRKQNEKTYIKMLYLRIPVISVIIFLLASTGDLFETVEAFVEKYEKYNIDELLIVGILMTFWLLFESFFLVKRLKNRSRDLQEAMIKDPLTGLYNRRGFFDIVDSELKAIRKRDNSIKYGIIYIDINNFKHYNDTYGHSIGDAILQKVAVYLEEVTLPDDYVARIGGDEFVIITLNCMTIEDVAYRNMLFSNVEMKLKEIQHTISISLSLGIACYPTDGNDIDSLMNKSDERMYEMKNSLASESLIGPSD